MQWSLAVLYIHMYREVIRNLLMLHVGKDIVPSSLWPRKCWERGRDLRRVDTPWMRRGNYHTTHRLQSESTM